MPRLNYREWFDQVVVPSREEQQEARPIYAFGSTEPITWVWGKRGLLSSYIRYTLEYAEEIDNDERGIYERSDSGKKDSSNR